MTKGDWAASPMGAGAHPQLLGCFALERGGHGEYSSEQLTQELGVHDFAWLFLLNN